jgi:hypothetical protein
MKPRGHIGKSEIIQWRLSFFISENVFNLTQHLFKDISGFKPFCGELLVSISDKVKPNFSKNYYKVNIEKNCKLTGSEVTFKTDKISFFKETKNHLCLTLGDERMQNTLEQSIFIFTMDLMCEIAKIENIEEFEFKNFETIVDACINLEYEYYYFYHKLHTIFIQNNELYIQTDLYHKIVHLLPETSIEYVLNINSYIAEKEQIGLPF